MATYHEELKERITEDANGNIRKDTTRTVKAFKKSEEPDYIKLYTKMWCEFNAIPEKWQALFFALVCRMSYANIKHPEGGQIVYTIGTQAQAIRDECGWKTLDPLYRGLNALCKCKAIRKIGKGEYQINPEYAGKGAWHYQPSAEQGGVQDLIAKFSFADKSIQTKIVWASTDKEEIGNLDEVTAKRQTITPIDGAAAAAPTDSENSEKEAS